jgi:HSP20 family protein
MVRSLFFLVAGGAPERAGNRCSHGNLLAQEETMAIRQYQPSTELLNPLFENFFGPFAGGTRVGNLMRAPAADVVETETELRVMLELPGLSAEHVSLDLENNVLTIRGEKQEQRTEDDEKHTWHLVERRYGTFSRSFVLPRDVDQDGIGAQFENGVLTIRIPKSEKARRRRIEIHGVGNGSGQGGAER